MKNVGNKLIAVKNGLVWGAVCVVLFLVFWYIMPYLINSFYYTVPKFLLNLVFVIFFCLEMRKMKGGYWSFSQALILISITCIVNMTFVFLFNLCFSKYIDTSYPEYMLEQATSFLENKYQIMGVAEEDIRLLKTKMERKLYDKFYPDLQASFTQFLYSLVTHFAIALVFAIIFTRKQNIHQK